MNTNINNKSYDKRYHSVDIIKGVLIILVIIGHVIPGPINGNPAKYFIYSFHMPLFIGISGYLLNYRWLSDASLFEILIKYRNRIIIPWLIASLVYFIFHEVQRSEVRILHDMCMELLFPFYHLWFIPAFISWIVLAHILGKSIFYSRNILLISITISLVTYVLSKNIFSLPFIRHESYWIRFIHETIRPYYFVFFVAGIKYKSIIARFQYVRSVNIFLLILILFCGYVFMKNELINFILYYFFNFLLLIWILKIISENMIPSVNWIEWMGINSMGIYLWHVLPIIIVKYFLYTNELVLYYALIFGLLSIFFIFYNFINQIKPFRRMLFGIS